MTDFLFGLLGAVGRPSVDGSGRTITRIASSIAALSRTIADLQCVPYARLREGGRAATTEVSTPVAEGIANLFDLPAAVTNFDARPFLCDRSRRAFWHPDAELRYDADTMPLPKVTGTTSRSELLLLAGRWDKIGRLLVARGGRGRC